MNTLLEKARTTLIYGEKTEHPDCIILMGLPGTGKSHVSRYLHEKYGYMVLSGENITFALFGDTKCRTEQYKEAYSVLYSLAKELLMNGYSIVIDGTNLQYVHRKQAYDAIGPQIKVFGIHLVIDDVIARKRIEQRGEKTDNIADIRSQCSTATFLSFKENIELPREDENIFTVISDEHIFVSLDEIMVRANL
ncbi:MAG: ATP-binding protein [Candidatus Gracilibacteria bacterium]|nr:ATP-binding protein [Candidatus Gracilibacteria bacterium]